jgi:hypothetical protein
MIDHAKSRRKAMRAFLLAVLLMACPLAAFGEWDFSKHSIPIDQIQSGGPPRDGIPALTSPKYVSAKKADFIRDDEQVLGVFLNGVARAYPTRILSWHELVNDRFGNLPVLVSW